MRAGRLRHRVTIQGRVEQQNATGEAAWTWADVATVWASIEPLNGREYFSAQQVQSSTNVRIRIRHRSGMTPKMRVRHVSDANSSPQHIRYYAIDAVIPVQERGHEMVLMCTERDASGFR